MTEEIFIFAHAQRLIETRLVRRPNYRLKFMVGIGQCARDVTLQ